MAEGSLQGKGRDTGCNKATHFDGQAQRGFTVQRAPGSVESKEKGIVPLPC